MAMNEFERHIIPISGKDSLCTAIVQREREQRDYEYLFNPTGLELPEVFDWLMKVEQYLGAEIKQVGEPLKPIISEKYNYFLPNQMARYCTRESKIEPMVEYIGKDKAIVYYGIRADEKRLGFNNSLSPNITPKYPLVEMGINLEAVYRIIKSKGLKPPTFFWQEMYKRTKERLGMEPKDILPEWAFDTVFAWRSRANCDRCFNQRYYEWVGLLEHYPDKYWEAESWEHKGSEYNWNANKSLQEIADQKEEIKEKRVTAIINTINKYRQYSLFEDKDSKVDILAVTSCGLFCGK